jgi:SAM-dependent methyltransferase
MPDFNTSVPNVARIYDYFLGGKDNYAADRDAAEELRKVVRGVEVACRQNREFLRRAVRYLAGEAGIGQFVDIGSGLPTVENTHQIAQAIRPGARVAYVDNDPIVVAHGRALLGKSPDVAVVEADLRQPGAITGDPSLRELVDLSQPTAFLLVAVLHFIPDSEDPYGIVGMLRSVMAPGSFLVISHATQDSVSAEEYADGVAVYEKASAPVVPRRYDEVLKFFDGMDLADPGLVNIGQWRTKRKPMRQLIYGGVARCTKPGAMDQRRRRLNQPSQALPGAEGHGKSGS